MAGYDEVAPQLSRDYEEASDRIPLRDWVSALRRRGLLGLAVAAAVFLAGVLLIFSLTPVFSGRALVMVETRRAELGDFRLNRPETQPDTMAVRSQIQILRSPQLADEVAKRLGLYDNPRYTQADPGVLARTVQTLTSAAAPLLNSVPALKAMVGDIDKPPSQPMDANAVRDRVVGHVLKNLDVTNDGRSYVMEISYSDEDPALAAAAANAFAQIYLSDEIGVKRSALNNMDTWLSGQIEALRAKVQTDDHAIETYRSQNGLLTTRGTTVVQQQLSELNSELSQAVNDRVAKQALVDEINRFRGGDSTYLEGIALASPLLQRLREQEADVARREQELKSHYLPRYPQVKAVEAEHAAIDRKIEDAVKTLAGVSTVDLATAKQRESALRSRVKELERSIAVESNASVKLSELERDAQTDRTLLSQMLSRAKEAQAQRNFILADARLVSMAPVPVRPSFPRRKLLVAIAGFVALMAGAAAAIAFDRWRGGIRTEAELAKVGKVQTFGIIPRYARAGSSGDIPAQLADEAEPFHLVRSLLPRPQHAVGRRSGHIVLVTSAAPAEGKTFFAANFAVSIATLGRRCLLVDCDLRRPSITEELKGDEHVPLEVGDASSPIGSIQRYVASGLHVAAPSGEIESPRALLESRRFAEWLERMRENYDAIVLDAPPVLAVADALHLARLADGVLFIVRWERTARGLVSAALDSLYAAGATIFGTVLTNVNLKWHRRYTSVDRAGMYARYRKSKNGEHRHGFAGT